MFTQKEEEWREADDRGSSEYRRRMTHEEICHCCDKGQYALRSASQNWRKSTDYCAGFNDYMTLHPSQLWFRNDLRQHSRQRQRRHSLKHCSRNSQCYRSEAIQNCPKRLDSTGHAKQSVQNSANLRTVRVMPKEFVFKLDAKDSRQFHVDNATDSANAPININESRKASNAPYYGPFRARLIKITPAMMPVKTRNYRLIQEYYSSERKYFREIQNDKPEIAKHAAFVKATHDKSNDSRIESDTNDHIISKPTCSEFDEIPLFASTIPKIDDQTNSLLTIPRTDNQMNPYSLSTATMIDESELPKKIFEKNSILNENQHETGHDKLMEGLTFKKGYEKYSSSNERNEIEFVSRRNSEIRENSQRKMQEMAIKKIANFWHRKTFKKINQSEKNLRKMQPTQFDHNLYDNQDDKVQQNDEENSRTISQNVDNTLPTDNGNQSKFITEIRQVRENLRKISKNSEFLLGDKTNVSKNGVISVDTDSGIVSEQLPSYSQEILTNYSIQPLIDGSNDHRTDAEFDIIPASRILDITAKAENEQDEQDASLAAATTIITPVLEESSVNVPSHASKESPKKALPHYSGRKHETITAEVYIRNPRNLKPAIINVSASDNKMRKPCWMIVKSYQSSCNTFDENISNENSISKGIVRIRSNTNLNKNIEKSKITNFPETTNNIKSTTITIPAVQQQKSEEKQTKEKLTSTDSKLQSEMNLTIAIQIDTSIRSKIITEKTIPSTDMKTDDLQTLITMKTDENCKINHTIGFERLITIDDNPMEICRRGSSIIFIFQSNNNPQILANISILFKNELANYEITISAIKYILSTEISKTNWHAIYRILTLNTALFEVITPSDIPVGLWQMTVRYDKTTNLCTKYLCILFNPWCKDDETYYSNEVELDEYVLNELAMIRKWHQKDAWLLGQFSGICINTMLYLLELCLKNNLLKVQELGSAFAIVKAIATAISKFILEVKWNDFQRSNYENEILPSAWTGSKEIMTMYRRMGSKIGYGQSWCYAGLLTSLCRCLGIPCRMITIYNFAPQIENGTLIKLDMINDMLAEGSKDTIWHYHIWNELWLQPRILGTIGNEWHVCDASPIMKGYDGLLNQRKALFPVRRIKNLNEKMRGQNDDEHFGQQLYGMLNADIIYNYYYHDPITHHPIFAYSKNLGEK